MSTFVGGLLPFREWMVIVALLPVNVEEDATLDAEAAVREYDEACEAYGKDSPAAREARKTLEAIESADRRMLDPYLELLAGRD